MASSFLLVTIMLALLFHTQANSIGNQAINPNSRLSNDLVAQAKTAAQKSIAATQTTSQIAKKYASGSTKGKAETCMETCGDAIDLLNKCLNVLKTFKGSRFDISNMQTWGTAAMTDVGTCDDEFGSGEPADLKNASVNAHKNIRSFLVIVNSM